MTGNFLYYAKAVDIKILVSLSAIVSEQANPTNTKMKKVKKLLNYAASHQDAIFTYHASYMILICHSNALDLSEPKVRSRVRGHFSYRRVTKP